MAVLTGRDAELLITAVAKWRPELRDLAELVIAERRHPDFDEIGELIGAVRDELDMDGIVGGNVTVYGELLEHLCDRLVDFEQLPAS